MFLLEFSACGGIRSGNKLPVLTAYFIVQGKGGLFEAPPLEDCLTRLPKLEHVVPIFSLSIAAWPTAKHRPDTKSTYKLSNI